ncbi:hypothetical protein D1AOALGA4SA_12396 [Olavius algarvensis Delta 1 endosymbiont]|nr:hypothetical protein D1AOALGA4SA_12396 [Olavius algarvensis Delta 1 endosymbiont]
MSTLLCCGSSRKAFGANRRCRLAARAKMIILFFMEQFAARKRYFLRRTFLGRCIHKPPWF